MSTLASQTSPPAELHAFGLDRDIEREVLSVLATMGEPMLLSEIETIMGDEAHKQVAAALEWAHLVGLCRSDADERHVLDPFVGRLLQLPSVSP